MHFRDMKLFFKFILIFLTIFLTSCGGKKSDFDYKIALDPSWYSLSLPGRESNLTAFTCELLEAVGKIEKVSIGVYQRSWSNLVFGLQEGEYNAICTTLEPYLFYEKMYNFSDLYLMTGPVLVTPINSKYTSLSQFSGLEIGFQEGSNAALILEKYPGIIQRSYDSIQTALVDTQNGTIEGSILGVLSARSYTQDLFQGQLKISSYPLTQEGIRLIGIKSRSTTFMRVFNQGLTRLKENGTYAALAKKWNLSE
jgi:polar amino acid transport system substrate-binding protein